MELPFTPSPTSGLSTGPYSLSHVARTLVKGEREREMTFVWRIKEAQPLQGPSPRSEDTLQIITARLIQHLLYIPRHCSGSLVTSFHPHTQPGAGPVTVPH